MSKIVFLVPEGLLFVVRSSIGLWVGLKKLDPRTTLVCGVWLSISSRDLFVQLLSTPRVRRAAGWSRAGVLVMMSVSVVPRTATTRRERVSSRATKSRDCTLTTLHLRSSVDDVTHSVSTAAPDRSLLY